LKEEPIVSASDLSDESLLRYYNAIAKQVEADRDSKHKLVGGDAVKEYAESLRLELHKRRLPYTAIDWSADQQANTSPKSDVGLDRNPVTEASAAEADEEKPTALVEAAESDVRDSVHPIDQADQADDRVDPVDPADPAVEPIGAVEQLKLRIESFMKGPGRSN
jgi:hypothetical protein